MKRMRESKRHNWNMADTVTAMRIVASLFLPFIHVQSIWFLVIYSFAGLTDVLDGWLARKSGRESEFGAKLDSIADLVFYGVMLTQIFPVLYWILPGTIWYAVWGIVVIRLLAYITAAVKFRRFASLHTWLNKLTGVAVFLLPYVLLGSYIVIYSWVVCVLAFAASLEELAIHLFRTEYLADRKALYKK
ncbi:MAG: CDP-alcohol phosphatidyltransferase family protein [Lachnospiraceae bacterium]